MIPKSKLCPCGQYKTYSSCCGVIHKDQSKAKFPLDLMRSRYSAFTLANGEYLINSHHQSKRNPKERYKTEKWSKSVKWIGLEIIDAPKISEKDHEGVVEFKAHFKAGLFKRCIHERSRFKKEDGIWYYVEAI